MPKKNNAAPNGAAHSEPADGALAEMSARYEAAKQFMIDAELRAAALRKALRAAVLELRRGTLERGELADALEAALHAPSDAELAREDEAQPAGEGVAK